MSFTRVLAAVVGVVMSFAGLDAAVAAPTAPDGATIFRQRCQSCHAVGQARPSTLGPSLTGVVGRKAASTEFKYSPALKASGVIWSKPNLDKFLSGPTKMVPGTRMVISLPDPAQRAAVIDYLSAAR
ncbi:c-type cytochrome [Phenylobacterium sp. LjRoot219]|uniref:c-type cytochrome n=1 Tax=Phenylobacterium sp. LjRoot219 TaxID=3342283 RepID=UPI003ECCE7FA